MDKNNYAIGLTGMLVVEQEEAGVVFLGGAELVSEIVSVMENVVKAEVTS